MPNASGCFIKSSAKSQKYLPTCDRHVDHIIFDSSAVNWLTLVDPRVISWELWDVQVWLRVWCVPKWLAITAVVLASAIIIKGYLTVFVFQVYFPDNKHHLVPCLIAALQLNFASQVVSWIYGNWKKETIVALFLLPVVQWLCWLNDLGIKNTQYPKHAKLKEKNHAFSCSLWKVKIKQIKQLDVTLNIQLDRNSKL